MRNDMLFIDGKLVDMDDNTKVTLNIKSNIFTDISKVVSNTTYTIKLPNTVRNQRVIEHSDLPACDSGYVRKKHQGRYFRNGVEIISKSSVVLLSISDTFELAMIWGNLTNFEKITNGDKKLTDIRYSDSDYIRWDNTNGNSDIFPLINYGFREGDKSVWYHPVVTVKWILDKIALSSGLKFIFPADRSTVLQQLIIPLLSRNDSIQYSDSCAITLSILEFETDMLVNRPIAIFDRHTAANYYGRASSYGMSTTNKVNGYESYISNGTPRLSGHIELKINAREQPFPPKLVVYNRNPNLNGGTYDTSTVLEIYAKEVNGSNGTYTAIFDFKEEKTQVLKNSLNPDGNKYIRFSFDNVGGTVVGLSGTVTIANIAEEVIVQKSVGESWGGKVYVDGQFWIVPNLPDIKQIDFMKAIASMLGLFAVSSEEDVIRFVSVDEVNENKRQAKDWTKRVVASAKANKPKGIEFTIDGFAQRNILSYKDDNTVTGSFNGILSVNDETLEYENNMITLPFAASDTKNGLASIPLYSYDADGNISYEKVEPRILLTTNGIAMFKGLEWEELIKKYYTSYQQVCRAPVIITEKIEISDIELKDIDVSIPVYLGQYGRYYAIISIKAEDTGICECKLLQLNV